MSREGTDPVSERVPALSGIGFFHVPTTPEGVRITEIEHDDTPIPDAALQWLILGCFRGAAGFEQFPIMIDHIEDNLDSEGNIVSFTIVTASGLRFTTTVTYEEES